MLPKQDIQLSCCCDPNLVPSLLKVWKLPGSEVSLDLTTLDRLKYRSWRLLNVSHKHKPFDDLQHRHVPPETPSQSTSAPTKSQRPSLFSSTTRLSLFKNDAPSSSDTTDISEDDYESSDDEPDDAPQPQPPQDPLPRPSASDLSYGVPLPDAFISNRLSDRLTQSRTSFVRGFSPNHISISSSSSISSRKTSAAYPLPRHTSSLLSARSRGMSQNSRNSSNATSHLSQLQLVALNNKNIFYICNSPSPPDKTKPKTLNLPRQNTNPSPKLKNGSSEHLARQDSLFSHRESLTVPGDCEPSPKSKNGSTEDLLAVQARRPQNSRQGSLFSNYQIRSREDVTQVSDNSSTDILDDEDEEDEVESDGEAANQVPHLAPPSTTSSMHRSRQLSMVSKSDNDLEWVSISSDSEQVDAPALPALNFDKRHPVSSYKVSGLSKIHPERPPILKSNSTATEIMEAPDEELSRPRSLLSGLFLNELANGTHSDPSTRHGSLHKAKPLLKRSSTTGIITIDQDTTASGRDKNKIKRPSILFSKKYASLTDISKKYPHYQKNLVKSAILNERGRLGPPASDDDEDESEHESAQIKQKSIVGISDLNVTTKASSIKSGDSGKQDDNVSSESLISSSLNKYTTNNTSLRNILSRSSLNISNIFQQKKLRRALHSEESKSPPLSVDVPESPVVNKSSSESSAHSSEMQKTDTHASTRVVRLSPKTTRRQMLSAELSKSLKDSLVIDYRLGKVPLPTKVVVDRVADEENYDEPDDYHSKGW